MKPTRSQKLFWCVSLTAIGFAAGCAHVAKPTKPIVRPAQAAAAANDFPSAIQAGIPAQNVKK